MMALLILSRAGLLLTLLLSICVAVPIEFTVELAVGPDPGPDDPAVQEHLRRQAELITNEKLERQDYPFRSSLSKTALQAEAIVSAIRQHEIDNFWRRAGSLGHEEDERFAGMMFAKAKPLIPSTTLWAIVSRMPKGSLLHAHATAVLDFETIFDILLDTEGMVISASQSVDTEIAAENATINFSHVNNITSIMQQVNASIHSPDYPPDSLVPLTYVAETYPGGRQGFEEFWLSKVTISDEEAVRHDLGVDAIWRTFQKCFGPAGSATSYEPVLRKVYQRLFEAFVDDGIYWAEFRSGGASASLVPEGQEVPDPDPEFQFRVLVDELQKFQATEKGKEFWGLRIIWSDIRGDNRERILGNMKMAIERKRNFPDLISGYDLVAQEDLGRPLSDLAPELLWFQNQTATLDLNMPFFFHAGETLGDGNTTDNNLFDALLLSARRIGHGFSLFKHPELMDLAKKQNVIVEVCPISSEVLRLSTDILHHPLPAMIAHGIPIAISNDDPAILGQDNPGLSYDFYQTIQGFDNIGLGGLGAMAQNSIRWSNFEDQNHDEWVRDIQLGAAGTSIKAQRIREWEAKWEAFCEWIVDEYSEWQNMTIAD